MIRKLLFDPGRKVTRIIELLRQAGADECLFVGGFVRDLLLGISSKDVDIEVYGLTYERILEVLRPKFRVGLVGRSFGTVKVDNEIDLSIPRIEAKTGPGHKGFAVSSDPNLDPLSAFSRRDFTINAIGLRLDGSVYDPFDGIGDLERGVLRAPTEAFCEDPLRVLRGMQFAARFGFDMEPRTIELCRRVRPEFETLSEDRIWGEWRKWAVKGRFPGKGLKLLYDTGWLDCFPELAALVHVPQNPIYHPEGDVFTHTTMVCDAAVRVADEAEMDESDREILLFAALCHDFGKPMTTVQKQDGTWSSRNHATEGVPLAVAFLERMKAPNRVVDHVSPLIREHLAHLSIPPETDPKDSVVRRLALRLEPSNIRMWATLCRADLLGRGETRDGNRIETWEDVAERLKVRDAKPRPILLGRDLMELGVEPGQGMGHLLKAAYEAQLDGVFEDRESAMQWIRTRCDEE